MDSERLQALYLRNARSLFSLLFKSPFKTTYFCALYFDKSLRKQSSVILYLKQENANFLSKKTYGY